jgi:hypothetical protein
MQPWAIISAIVGILALIVTVFLQLNGSINEKIESKLKDPEFISKVADEVKLPFVIFDENNSIIVDTGAMNIIDKISINKANHKDISEIIITPKKYLAIAPILESLDPKIEFQDPIKGNKFDFIYKRVEMAVVWANTYASTPPKSKFLLQVIILPKEKI